MKIWPVPVEVENPIPFEQDHKNASYDAEYATRFWRILVQAGKVFEEFILLYDGVRSADSPEAVLMSFLQSTYDAGADLAKWDRAALERTVVR